MSRWPRKPSSRRGYDSTWRRIRNQHIRNEPLCRTCRIEGRTTPAQVVDHVVPHRMNETLRVSEWNLQSMCERCHNRKSHGERDPAWVNARYPLDLPESGRRLGIIACPPGYPTKEWVQSRPDKTVALVRMPEVGDLLTRMVEKHRTVCEALAFQDDGGVVWMETTGPTQAERVMWQELHGAEVYTLTDQAQEDAAKRLRARGRWGPSVAKALALWHVRHDLEVRGIEPPVRGGAAVDGDGNPTSAGHHWS